MSSAPQSALMGLHADAIRAADTLFKLALDASPGGVVLVGPGGTIALVNHALEEQFGYSGSELVGKPVEVLLPKSLRLAHDENPRIHSSNPRTRPMGGTRELVGRHKDGSEVPVEIGLNTIETPDGKFVLVSIVDISERRRQENKYLQALNERVEFERLIGEIAASFVDVAPEQIDGAICDAQSRIVEALAIDRSTLFRIAENRTDLVLTHYWERPGEDQATPLISANGRFPWSLSRISHGQVVCFSSIDEVPDAIERETLRQYGTRSGIAIPLRIAGRIIGAISFASKQEERQWPEEILNRLGLIAQVFAGALARRDADLALRASEERFRTLANNSPMMIWIKDRDKLCTWFNRQWLEFVGQTFEHEIGNGWSEGVHVDDLQRCLQTYTTAFESHQPFSVEYRLCRNDGAWRWIHEVGTPNYSGDGTFEGYIGSCADTTEQRQAKINLEGVLMQVQNRHDQLDSENVYLRREVKGRLGRVIGRSTSIRHVLEQVEQVSRTDSTVLLLGETGTGKELFATQIHEQSSRNNRTMVRVNCAAIPSTLIESELFGREKGAYTGALTRQAGRFELAHQSTIFLDEIGDLPPEVQVKLLRVLEERQIERLGSLKGTQVDTRIIAATHRNLEQQIADGTFREDLFYRLNVFPIRVPPLRERLEDIPFLVWHFIEEFSRTFGKRIEAISRENMAALQAYSWPGNIRELRNVVERAMIVATSAHLTVPLPHQSAAAKKHSGALVDVEREHILKVLNSTGWRVRGSGGAAARLGFKPTTLETRMAKLGISRPNCHC